MSRGRSISPRANVKDVDMDVDSQPPQQKPDAKVVIITNLTRNVVESHLKVIFGFYGEIIKVDLPVLTKSGQNRGKAALEFADSSSAHNAASHMDGGQLDGAVLKVELSDLPIRSASRSRSPIRPPPRGPRNGRDRARSLTPSRSRVEIRATETAILSVEGHTVAEDLPHATPTVRTALALDHALPFVEVLLIDLLHPGDVHQATPGEATAVADRGATPFAQVALVRGLSHHALARVLCPIRVIHGTLAAVVEQGLSARAQGEVGAETI